MVVILVEGLPGAGKTTLISRLSIFLEQTQSYRVAVVPEELGIPDGANCRADFDNADMQKRSRGDELSACNDLVLHDRSWISTAAYSAAFGGFGSRSTPWVYPEGEAFILHLSFSSLSMRRRVGRQRERWDDDDFAAAWESAALELERSYLPLPVLHQRVFWWHESSDSDRSKLLERIGEWLDDRR